MRWKWILGISAAVAVVLLVVAYFIAASYDYNKFKPLITETTMEYTGRKLSMDGDIALKFALPPTLQVNDVAFQNAAWGSQPQLARVKHLQVKVSLLPFCRCSKATLQLTASFWWNPNFCWRSINPANPIWISILPPRTHPPKQTIRRVLIVKHKLTWKKLT